MIKDNIANSSLYYGLGPQLETALKLLQSTNFSAIDPGRYDLEDGMFYTVEDYDTLPKDQGVWESHRRYLDVQYIAFGSEMMGCTEINGMSVCIPYNENTDLEFFEGSGDYFTVPAGTFAIFMPHDLHMPKLAVDQPERVRKVVVKIPV